MSFLENLKEFFSVAKETNFDLGQIYTQTPDGVYSVVLVLAAILLIVVFFIRRSVKISSTVKLVSQIQNAKSFDEYNSGLSKLAAELPKRGKKVADSINVQKNDILNKELELLKDFNIKEKIEKYQQISSQYALIASNSKKYSMDELTSYYEETSKTLLSQNLAAEIEEYYTNSYFTLDDVEFVNSIVTFANSQENTDEILNPMIREINSYSYAFNLDLFKFTKALSKDESNQVYTNCTEKLSDVLSSKEDKVSDVVLSYMLDNGYEEDVYAYVSGLENAIYLQDISNNLFAKKDNINLDLAFVANETKIDVDYAFHIDSLITDNWRDLGYIKHIIASPRVLETIGHISYRNVLERIERLETEEENNKAIAEALETARRAESIANEAKAIARQK
ncbi:hypothetical protein [Poseidonibacter lekithochrous]|uniref:hypothetical protein n=1 Tax=Poseidonibacter lekithochrous TaxID=1904463 RepID=UPI0008FC2F76|nr:hypothetical protein [Poseidonibacter lekithochrous]QKJ22707.1 hypothetical protein ALEK_1436 [Poseidonibacter lekithochrous]